MAVLNEMEQEARAMLADSRDYHTLEGAFLLVRDGHAVWLCRQGEGAALDACERLLLVATEEAKPLTMAETVAVLQSRSDWTEQSAPLTMAPRYVVDGAYPPFVIFDTLMQWNLPNYYPTRDTANAALARLGNDPATELEGLHLELRDVHDGEADDDTDFDVWVRDMAANNEGLFQNAAKRFIELEKLLDVQ